MNVDRIRLLAKAERMMDAGEIPWVWAIGPSGNKERLSVNPEVMEILELEQAQSVNSFIVDAIAELSTKILAEKLDDIIQQMEENMLDENFDFRKEMDK